MKEISVKILAVAALSCALASGLVAWRQHNDALELQKRVALLGAEIGQKSGQIKDQEALIRQLRQENETYNRESAALREKLSAQTSAPTVVERSTDPVPAPSPSASPRREFAKMFDDPKMKKMFRQSHQLHLKQLYSDFIKERHLDKQQAEKFYDLLTDGELNDVEDGLRSLDKDDKNGSADDTLVTQVGGFDRQLRTLLGEGNYAAYKNYEQTIGDRMALAQVREQINLAGSALRDDQAKAVLQVMTEERSRSLNSSDPDGPGSYRDKFRMFMEPDSTEKYLASKADRNKRVLDRMAGILTQEQYDAFERYQQNQLEMEKMGIEMSREMMEKREDKDALHTYTVTPSSE